MIIAASGTAIEMALKAGAAVLFDVLTPIYSFVCQTPNRCISLFY